MKWRVNFTIKNCNFNLIGKIVETFISYIPKKDGRQLFREWIFDYSDGTFIAYVPVDVIEEVTGWIRDKVIQNPEWADELHRECEKLNRDYYSFAKEILTKNIPALSNADLINLYSSLRRHQSESHGYAVSTTWFLESDGEIYSNYLRKKLDELLKNKGVQDPYILAEYFTLLTSPTKENMAQEEQLDFLNLLKKIKSIQNAYNLFRQYEPGQEMFNLLPQDIQAEINQYFNKWKWTPYGYTGPAYDLNYYLQLIKETLVNLSDIDAVIAEETNRHPKLKKDQEELLVKLNMPAQLNHLFAVARDMIWLKDFRKYCIWHGHYVLDFLTKEIAKRLYITHKQANHFLPDEIGPALMNNTFDEHILNERIRHCAMRGTENGIEIFYGTEANKLIEGLDVEEVKVDVSEGWKGTTACPGEVEGAVKIVHSVEDIDKVEKGDIMIALTTYPSFLPAMKRAAAIVTEDGGITCHAAIVAREFRIPCVVGAKKITQLLKDGEKIKVDATRGTVKKI